MHDFPLYLDGQNNHYECDLLGISTFKPIPYSHWIKNNTQQKQSKQKPFPLKEKENLTDTINLSGPLPNDLKYTMNQVFNLHDPLDTIPLSKLEVESIFYYQQRQLHYNYYKNFKTLTLLLDNSNYETNIKRNQQKLIQQF